MGKFKLVYSNVNFNGETYFNELVYCARTARGARRQFRSMFGTLPTIHAIYPYGLT